MKKGSRNDDSRIIATWCRMEVNTFTMSPLGFIPGMLRTLQQRGSCRSLLSNQAPALHYHLLCYPKYIQS